MSEPRFGERVPVKHGLDVKVQLRPPYAYPTAVWELIEDQAFECLESTVFLQNLKRVPPIRTFGSLMGLSVGMWLKVTFLAGVGSVDQTKLDKLEQALKDTLAPYGVKWVTASVIRLG
jgi:hypothetical protein